MKTTLSFIVVIILMLTACSSAQDKGLSVAAILPLTGAQSFYGEYALAGITLAVEDINSRGGVNGQPLTLRIEDSQSDKAKAVSAAQQMIASSRPDAFFTVGTPTAAVLSPLAEQEQIPFIYQSSAISVALNKTYTFDDFPSMREACVNLMRRQNGKVALFGTNAEFTHLCAEGARTVEPFVVEEMYAPGTTDFRSFFEKIKGSGADALLLLVFAGADCTAALTQITEIGLDMPLLLPFPSFACGSSEHITKHSAAFDGAIAEELLLDESLASFKDFKTRLEQKGRVVHLGGSALAYDGLLVLARAWEGCETPACAREQLSTINVEGVSGTIRFEDGQVSSREIQSLTFDDRAWKSE